MTAAEAVADAIRAIPVHPDDAVYLERIASRVACVADDACAYFDGAHRMMRDEPRPVMKFDGQSMPVARVLLTLKHHDDGTLFDGWHALHQCNNGRCINPAHLYVGTRSDNTLDTVRDGVHGSVRLSDDEVRAIRADERVQSLIAADFGIAQSYVSRIKRRMYRAEVAD